MPCEQDVLVPCDRVLYVDADTLCRRDVLQLCGVNTKPSMLGAVVDFGMPNHFNAGLLLLDLAALRLSGFGERLRACAAHDGPSLPYKDQSVLNSVIEDWTPLPLTWNAQGLGTYAIFRTKSEPQFPALFSADTLKVLTDDPDIVHFTGAGSFSIALCLNPYSPGATKPWVPLCKNPWREAWFATLAETHMRSWKPLLLQSARSVARETLDALELISTDTRCAPDDLVNAAITQLKALALPRLSFEIAVLLPLRCTDEYPAADWVQRINDSFASSSAKLFIGIDENDPGWAECLLAIREGPLSLPYQVKTFPPVKPAIICPIWASLALDAYADGCSYFILWGDDVSVEPNNWLDQLREHLGCNELGCVAPLDANDPSLATFPIVTRAHLDLFGALFPADFVNQDADPYLFELYRRVGKAHILNGTILTNRRGGAASWLHEAQPRYTRQPLLGWKETILAPNAQVLSNEVGASFVTIDVVVPSFRTPFSLLRRIVSLADPPGCSVKFIVIVDDPSAPNIADIVSLQNERVRVRVNSTNLGAPASRSRGLAEACSDWVLFLDDDVEIQQSCLDAYARAAADKGSQFSGFVGSTKLPLVTSLMYEATRLSDITFFYDLPGWMGDNVPWGVTANLLVRHVDGLTFDEDFAKTGGGEDVDYCIRIAAAVGKPLGRVVDATVIHDWWPCASSPAYLRRFWKWTMGDGHLMYKHPQFVYVSFPNVIELSLCLGAATPFLTTWTLLKLALALWLVEIGCDATQAMSGPESRHLSPTRRLLAALLSPLFKNTVDLGHMTFHLLRGRPFFLLHRFDWFLGNYNCVELERARLAKRNMLWIAAAAIIFRF